MVAGTVIADTTSALYLFEHGRLPIYYLPRADVRTDLLVPTGTIGECPRKGTSTSYSVIVPGDHEAARRVDMAWCYSKPLAGCELLSDYIAFDWNSADAWFEEDDEVFKHARDPYHRVDTLHSSRRVQVFIDGVQVAESSSPRLLFETGLPTRYYLPKVDVRLDLLVPSHTHSVCPYKGTASYYSVQLPDGGRLATDIVWYYPAPIAECPKIENLLCFFNEKVDIVVDGVAQPRPVTPWS
jgi:uncharacterized protein (DUF427 family)